MTRYIIYTILLLNLFSCSSNQYFISPEVIDQENNTSKELALKYEEDKQHRIQKRDNRSRSQGQQIAKNAVGANAVLDARENIEKNPSMVSQYTKDVAKKTLPALQWTNPWNKKPIMENAIKEAFFMKGFDEAFYNSYIKATRKAALLHDTKIGLINSEFVHKPEKMTIPFTLDYYKIIDVLCQEEGDHFLDKEIFSLLLAEVNIEFIKYLTRNLVENTETFTFQNEDDALTFYEDSIHEDLTEKLYPIFFNFIDEYRSKIDDSFFDNNCYLNLYSFIKVITANAGRVVDAAFTYSKGNPEFAASSTFVIGKIDELILEKAIIQFQDALYKLSLSTHYSHLEKTLIKQIKEALRDRIVDIRKETAKIVEVFRADDFYVEAEIDIIAIAQFKLNVEDIDVHIDNKEHNIYVYVPKTPELDSILYLNHKLISTRSFYEKNCKWNRIFNRRYRLQSSFTEKELDNIVSKYIPADFQSLEFCQIPFKNQNVSMFFDLLVANVEPIISTLPHSNYNVTLVFGQQFFPLVQSGVN